MAITLTPAALDRIRGYLPRPPGALGLRFGVKRTGCSGLGLRGRHGHATRAPATPCSSRTACAIYVDADSLALVDGTEIDFVKQGLNEQFVFRNPNVAGRMRLRRELHHRRPTGPPERAGLRRAPGFARKSLILP